MAFVSDTFTDSDSTALESHTGETGATWTKHPNESPSTSFQTTSNQLEENGVAGSYYASGSPASAEYDCAADFITHTSTNVRDAGLLARVDTAGSKTYYLAQHDQAGDFWRILKCVSGAFTVLGTYSQVLSDSTTYAVVFEVRDASKKMYIDAVQRISTTNNDITSAGKVGVRIGRINHDLKLDNFSATDPAGGTTVAAGLASETDSALAVTSAKQKAIGQASETDSALAATGDKTVAVGIATSTETALAISSAKTIAVGIATETDSALAVTRAGTTTVVGQASETETALNLTSAKQKALGQASETDTAPALTTVKSVELGIVSEIDTALAISRLKARTAGLATETDVALPLVTTIMSVAGPYRFEAFEAFVPGAAAQQVFVPGAERAQVHVPGAVAIQSNPQ